MFFIKIKVNTNKCDSIQYSITHITLVRIFMELYHMASDGMLSFEANDTREQSLS